jgi:hypothetical protein
MATKKCCEVNTCVEIVPSKCVKYTGTPTTDGPIDKEFNCTPYLNDIIGLFDDDLKEIIEKIGISKTALDAANTSCGLSLVNTATLDTYDINTNSYSQSEVIVQLLTVICNLKKEVNYLKNGNTTTNSGNVFWLDLPLDADFKNFITLNGSCLIDQPCVPAGGITTLRLLLQAMITKLCSCCE